MAFQRAVQEIIRLKPDLIFLVGDIFDRPDPPPGALVALARGLEAFRSAIPATQIFMVAGARDTPRLRGDPGALADVLRGGLAVRRARPGHRRGSRAGPGR